MRWRLSLLLACTAPVAAAEAIKVCYNYGCQAQAEVIYSDEQLAQVRALLGSAQTAADERQKLSLVIGWLLGWAGQQTPISADRGGNWADDGVYGRMDCIDHSTTTTRLLRLLETRGWLRFHRVLEPEYRVRYLFQVHYSAQIEEVVPAGQASGELAEPARYVVDTWFRDNGRPAVVMTLQRWLAGDDENGEGKEEAAAAAAGESVSDSHGER
ncbi:hypothetical protein [Accumulibacter sp.]|uniref:hypothetical protein n=1 Tax=Accumulibacter sp. TaxID=2053492 RepID=UPI0028C42C09|nr:hypothetical protein [Accumulibacter sp.]